MKIIQTIEFTGTIGLTRIFRLACVKSILKSGGDTPVLILRPELMAEGEPTVVLPGEKLAQDDRRQWHVIKKGANYDKAKDLH